MACTPQELAEASKCFRCLDPRTINSAQIYTLCTWANGGVTPDEAIVLGDPDSDFMFGDPIGGIVFGDDV